MEQRVKEAVEAAMQQQEQQQQIETLTERVQDLDKGFDCLFGVFMIIAILLWIGYEVCYHIDEKRFKAIEKRLHDIDGIEADEE